MNNTNSDIISYKYKGQVEVVSFKMGFRSSDHLREREGVYGSSET